MNLPTILSRAKDRITDKLFADAEVFKEQHAFLESILRESFAELLTAYEESVVPEAYKEEWMSKDRSITSDQMKMWNACREEILRRSKEFRGV